MEAAKTFFATITASRATSWKRLQIREILSEKMPVGGGNLSTAPAGTTPLSASATIKAMIYSSADDTDRPESV